MRLSTLLISTILLAVGLTSCNFSNEKVFTDETYQDTIKQDIGGLLIRKIHHYDDFQSIIYDINYSFKDNRDSVSVIGSGSFYSQKPTKNEQIINISNWKVFKTCRDRDKDVIFVYNNSLKTWTEYEISPETIEKTDLWKNKKIDSQVDNWDSVSKIEKINKNGNVTVLYTYPKKNRIFTFLTDKRLVIYQIDLQTGKLELKQIVEP